MKTSLGPFKPAQTKTELGLRCTRRILRYGGSTASDMPWPDEESWDLLFKVLGTDPPTEGTSPLCQDPKKGTICVQRGTGHCASHF